MPLTHNGGRHGKKSRNLRPRFDRQANRGEPAFAVAPDHGAARLGGGRAVQRCWDQRSQGRDGRPGLDQMLKDASKRRFDIVMAWAIDRLGRSLIDLLGTIQTLEACGVDLYLDQQSIDTTAPAGRLMFQVCGAFGEFARSMIRQRVNAGLKRAVEQGKHTVENRIRELLRAGVGIIATARKVGVGTGTVQRIKQEMTGPFAVGAA
jgi:DNA invertase Pin-like site-specific DNA recombinase